VSSEITNYAKSNRDGVWYVVHFTGMAYQDLATSIPNNVLLWSIDLNRFTLHAHRPSRV